MLTKRPDTFAQTKPSPSLFACSKATDHTSELAVTSQSLNNSFSRMQLALQVTNRLVCLQRGPYALHRTAGSNHFRDLGSDLFTGDLALSSESNSRAQPGTPTLPPRMISFALSFFP